MSVGGTAARSQALPPAGGTVPPTDAAMQPVSGAASVPPAGNTAAPTVFERPSSVAPAGQPGAVAPTQPTPAHPGTTQPGSVQPGAASVPAGPPAWNDAWRKKFADAGAPDELLLQLSFSGGQGMDEAQLRTTLHELKTEVGTLIADFRKAHPKEYATLSKKLRLPDLVNIAAQVKAGKVTDKQLKQQAEVIGMSDPYAPAPASPVEAMVQSTTKMFTSPRMLLSGVLPWTFIPGYGALRAVGGLFTGGRDPFMAMLGGDDPMMKGQSKIHYDFWNGGIWGAMDLALFLGGATSLFNSVRGVRQIGMTMRAARQQSGALGLMAAREGVANLRGVEAFKAYLPRTRANAVVSGLSRLNGDLARGTKNLQWGTRGDLKLTALDDLKSLNRDELGVAKLEKLSADELGARGLAELTTRKWLAGDVDVVGHTGFGILPFGFGSNVRGAVPGIGNRKKQMFEWQDMIGDAAARSSLSFAGFNPNLNRGRATLVLDGRLGGESLAAHWAAAGLSLVKPSKLGLTNADAVLRGPRTPMAALQRQTLAEAGAQLQRAGVITPNALERSPLGWIWSKWRPGPKADVLKAIKNPSLPKPSVLSQKKVWIPATIAGGAGVSVALPRYMQHKAEQAAKEQRAELEKQQRRQAQAGGVAGEGAFKPTAQEQAGIQEFRSMPADQQLAFLQQQYASIEAAAAEVMAATGNGQRPNPQRAAAIQHDLQLWEALAKVAAPEVQAEVQRALAAAQGGAQGQQAADGVAAPTTGPLPNATADATAGSAQVTPQPVPLPAPTPASTTPQGLEQAQIDAATAQALAQVR